MLWCKKHLHAEIQGSPVEEQPSEVDSGVLQNLLQKHDAVPMKDFVANLQLSYLSDSGGKSPQNTLNSPRRTQHVQGEPSSDRQPSFPDCFLQINSMYQEPSWETASHTLTVCVSIKNYY